ncbi:MAG: NADH-quinone oxidoreductase subunit N [Deltaproteobacteria bacterium]|nr:NADH-quinone oxidoreductase subunit N [Deltaproteobacteria bacterium]
MFHIDLSQYRLAFLAPEMILCGFAFLLLLLGAFTRAESNRHSAGWIAVTGFAIAIAVAFAYRNAAVETLFGAIRVDGFSSFFKIVIFAGSAIAAFNSMDYLRRRDIQECEFFALLVFAAIGMSLLASSSDLIAVLVCIEIMSLAVYVLVGIRPGDGTATEAALKYFTLGAFASGILVFGIALVYGSAGSIRLEAIAAAAKSGAIADPTLFRVGLAMVLSGFAFKVAAVPFHMWAPDVYQGAPAPVTGFMAMGVKAAAFAAAIRVFQVAFGGQFDDWRPIVWMLALVTMVLGNFLALMQDHVKRLLAYSSIAHAGYVLVGLAGKSDALTPAMMFYLGSYAFMTLGTFAVLSAISDGDGERDALSEWRGIGRRRPVIGALMAMFLFSLAGIPPFAGFFAKFYLFYAAVEAGDTALVLVAVGASFVSLYYYLKVIVVMYMNEAEATEPATEGELGFGTRAALALASLGVLGLGLLPSRVLEWAASAAPSLFR